MESSPFEISICPVADDHSKPAPERIRSRARQFTKSRKLTTHWKKKRDIFWQKNPDRVLKYHPSHLHYYGWIPFGIWRNIKATVFSEIYLHVQTFVLLAWMALIHWTGLGVPDKDLAAFVVMFGTAYLGAIFNYGMVVVFILGLFITLVINRWWVIRTAYAKLMGTTTDLCMVVASAVHNSENMKDGRTNRARTEITRLLNLGHLLVITRADEQNEDFVKSRGVRTCFRSLCEFLKRQTDLKTRRSEGPGSPIFTQALYKPRRIRLQDLLDEGLLNEDERVLLEEGEQEGMPKYHLVYYWTQALINNCRAAGWIISAPQMLPLMLNKINTIVESGSQIITTVNSQMPYPYVHLVSFVVHMYLIVLSTWFGSFLHTGQLGRKFHLETINLAGDLIQDDVEVKSSSWVVFWCYMLMGLANVTFQGLLDMHTLLDNPFGNHCTKFPLRAQVGEVTNASRTMLTMADKFPAAFDDVFQKMEATDAEESTRASSHLEKPSVQRSEFADFLNPSSTTQFRFTTVGSVHLDKERSRRHNPLGFTATLKDRLLSGVGHRDRLQGSRSQPVDKTPDNSTPRTQPSNRDQEGTSPPNTQRLSDMTTSNLQRLSDMQGGNSTTERRESLQSSGDAQIQEMFLKGAVEDAMQRSAKALQDPQIPTTSHSFKDNPPSKDS